MSVNLLGLLSGSASASTFWKPVSQTAESGGHFVAVEKPARLIADSVELSELGSQLSGRSAEIFGALDGKVRTQLEDFVKKGLLTAKEVQLGLAAETLVRLRFQFNATAALTKEQEDISKRMKEVGSAMSAQIKELAKTVNIPRGGEGSGFKWAEEVKTFLQSIQETFDPDDGLGNAEEMMILSEKMQKISFERFKSLDMGFDMPAGDRLVSVEAGEASRKITELFSQFGGMAGVSAYRKGVGSYVKSFTFPSD